MKIALVCLNLSNEGGGTRFPWLLLQEIKKNGHDVTVYTAKFDPKAFLELHSGIIVKEIPSPIGEELLNKTIFQKIKERVIRERLNTKAAANIANALPKDLDMIICHNDQSYKIGRFLCNVSPRAKFIWVMHNAPFRHTKKVNFITNILSIIVGYAERLRVRFYLRYIDVIVVNDEEQRKLLHLVGREALLLPIPVNFERFYREVSVKNITEPILLGVGSLTPARSYEDIISAGIILRQAGIRCRVVLVCNDSLRADKYREKLISLAKEIDEGTWVEFHFKSISDEELSRIHAESFVFIFPNHIKIWGMAAFEAMAAGLPLIVSNSTSVADALCDDENSLFVNPAQPVEIASKVKFLLDNPQKYKSIATAGQEFVKKNLKWDRYVEKFLSVLF